MKRWKTLIILVAALSVLVVGAATADVINPRPFTPPSGDLSALQAVFTGIGSTINVNTDQESAAIFNPTGFGSSAAAFIATVTWGWPSEFGLYEYGNPSNQVTVIPVGASLGTQVTIYFDFGNGTVTTREASTGNLIDSASFTRPFGFYTLTQHSTGNLTFFSEDSLNTNSTAPQQLIYEGKGDMVTVPYNGSPQSTLSDIAHFYVACEGLAVDGTYWFGEGAYDYNDMIVMLESVQPVPVPGALLLLGAGLVRLAAYSRRRRNEV